MAVVTPKEKQIIATAARMDLPATGKKKLTARTLDDNQSDWIKILMLGPTGSGKTYSIAGLLEAGERVFVASTDMGGSGLRTVKAELVAQGHTGLLANLAEYEFADYKEFAAFTSDPNVVEVGTRNGVVPLWDFDPTVLVWDGLANFQESMVWQYVQDLTPINEGSQKSSVPQAREEGVQAYLPEWGQIRRITILQIDNFLTLQSPKRKLHKLVTCLLDDGKEDKLTGTTQKGALIMGAARSYVPVAFDLILTCVGVVPPGAKAPKFSYKCAIGGTTTAKTRGLQVAPEEPADMKTLWQRLTRAK